MEEDVPDYDIDSEDEKWLSKQKLDITPLKVRAIIRFLFLINICFLRNGEISFYINYAILFYLFFIRLKTSEITFPPRLVFSVSFLVINFLKDNVFSNYTRIQYI